MSNQYMPAVAQTAQAVANLRQAASSIGSGGSSGETYLKVDDRSGALTFGQERTPFPPNHRCVVSLQSFCHGYIEMQGGKPNRAQSRMVPMVSQSQRPTPAGPYATGMGDGPKDTTELTLNSLDEPGFNVVFTAWSKSSSNRVRNLLEKAIVQMDTPGGQAGFINPVIIPKSGHYWQKAFTDPLTGQAVPARNVHHFDFEIIDWMHNDGQTLLSSRGGAITQQDEPAPWDDEDDDTSPEERELLRA